MLYFNMVSYSILESKIGSSIFFGPSQGSGEVRLGEDRGLVERSLLPEAEVLAKLRQMDEAASLEDFPVWPSLSVKFLYHIIYVHISVCMCTYIYIYGHHPYNTHTP